MKKNIKIIIFAIVIALVLAIIGRLILSNLFQEKPTDVVEKYFKEIR